MPTDAPAWLELRPDHRGEFDELIARGLDTAYFEMLDDNEMFVCLKRGDREMRVWISARGKLTVTTEGT